MEVAQEASQRGDEEPPEHRAEHNALAAYPDAHGASNQASPVPTTEIPAPERRPDTADAASTRDHPAPADSGRATAPNVAARGDPLRAIAERGWFHEALRAVSDDQDPTSIPSLTSSLPALLNHTTAELRLADVDPTMTVSRLEVLARVIVRTWLIANPS